MTAVPAAAAPGEWPLVGRDGELRLLSRLVSRPEARGVVLAGPAGVGKTRLAVESLRAAESAGFATARIAGTPSAVGMAFAAMAPLTPTLERAGGEGTDVLRRFAAAMAERAGSRRLALMVDDAHFLDGPSATLLYQLAVSDTAFLVVTLRAREVAPEPIPALWKEGLLQRFEVTALAGDNVEELLVAVLGGPVDPSLVARLSARSGGNLLFLRELVLGARASGAIGLVDGTWSLVGTLSPSPRLIELVEARLGDVDEEDRIVLEALAAAESLGPGRTGLSRRRVGGGPPRSRRTPDQRAVRTAPRVPPGPPRLRRGAPVAAFDAAAPTGEGHPGRRRRGGRGPEG